MNLPDQTLKKRIHTGECTFGSWLSFGFTPICEMMARLPFDWLVIDMEHTAISTSQMFNLIQIIDLNGVAPLVRVGTNDSLLIKRALDSGAHGVVVPMVNDAEDAKRAVASSYYPPNGDRGVGLSRAQNYGTGFDAYKAWAAESTVVIVQIEHIKAVENIESILKVEGVDGFIIGPYDLSGSLGRPGDFTHPDVAQALERVRQVMLQRNICGGYHVVQSNQDVLTGKIKEGYRFLAYGDDMVFLAEKLQQEQAFLTNLRKI